MTFHKIINIVFLEDYVLLAEFKGGEWKRFDLKPMMEKYPPFSALKDKTLYESGKIDMGGFGIVWNDEVDISSEGIFEKGEKVSEGYSSTMMDIASYVKFLRSKNGLSQNDLSHLSGVSQSTIARIERKDIDPTISTIEKILRPFGLSLSVK